MMPGPELDVLIAEKVMGWKVIRFDNIGLVELVTEDDRLLLNEFRPSKDISDAWMVVDKLKISVIPQEDGAPDDMKYLAELDDRPFERDLHQQFSCTAPLAICLVALKYVGLEIPYD